MRQTIKERKGNVAYRGLLGIERMKCRAFNLSEKLRRFEGTDIFERIFKRIPEERIKNRLVKPKEIFAGAARGKAYADRKKFRKEIIGRLFGTAKEQNGFRYMQMMGKTKIERKFCLFLYA